VPDRDFSIADEALRARPPRAGSNQQLLSGPREGHIEQATQLIMFRRIGIPWHHLVLSLKNENDVGA